MICDSLGRPLRFRLTAGQRHDNLAAKDLLEGFDAQAVLADRAYDNNDLRQAIADMGAEAVIPSTRSRKQPIPHDPEIYKLRNRIERCGQQFYGAVAVWVGLAREMQISHNEIAWHPYTGVSLGWMWNPTPTPARENVVSRNHIHHVMQVLSDGGGIYTLGRQPGTKLLGNIIHDVPLNAGRAESNGMFLDEGSDQIEIAGNTIYGTARSPLQFSR